MKRYLTALFLTAALAGSVSLRADDDDHEHRSNRHVKRYYDPDARDYHEWNQHENDLYRQYAKENRKRERDFAKMNRRERQEYFRWRHSHPDMDRR